MGTPQKLAVVVGPDPTLVATVVVPFVTEPGQFQEVGGVASGSVVMVVVVVVLPLVCEMAKTSADVPLVESVTLAFPST
jgi:hypothetical protein